MPKIGDEVYLSELEVKILNLFIQEKELSDKVIADTLDTLSKKLKGEYDENKAKKNS